MFRPPWRSGFREPVWLAVVAVGVFVAAFLPLFQAEFINYDDPVYVTENSVVRNGLTGEGAAWAFSKASAGRINLWHPLTWLSHMADVSLFGIHGPAHHISGLALHLGCAVLVAFLLRDMTAGAPAGRVAAVSILTGLAWAIHPCRVEVVGWVSERKEILCAFLVLAAALCWLRAGDRPALKAAGLGLFVLACLAKPVAVALPVALLAFPVEGRRRGLIPWFIVGGILSLLTIRLQEAGGHSALSLEQPLAYRLWRIPWNAVRYCFDFAGVPPRHLFRYPQEISWAVPLMSAATLAGVAICVGKCRMRLPLLFAGFVWSVAFFLPVSGLIPVSVYDVADRYSYLPHIGLLMMLAETVRRWRVAGIVAVLGPACVAWSVVTHLESRRWRGSAALFSDELRTNPRSLLAHVQYGHALLAEGRKEVAMGLFQAATTLDPLASIGPLNVGLLHEEAGNIAEAEQAFRQAVARRTQNGRAHQRLAVILSERMEHGAALKVLEEGLERHPKDLDLLHAAAVLLATELHRKERAVGYFRKAVGIAPNHPDLLQGLGVALLETGATEEARVYLRQALEQDPSRTYLKAYLSD